MATPSMSIHVNQTKEPPAVKREPQSHIKCEPQEDLPIVAIQPQPPQFLKSIQELNTLSSCINEFYRRFHELQHHLESINTAIQQFEQQPQQSDTPITAAATFVVETQPDDKKDATFINSTRTPSKSSKPEVISLCEMMCGRGLRKYLTSNLSDIQKLRSEVPPALKCAPNPAKLVLDCVGGFYLQGSKAFTKESHMIPGRKASILVLEFFMLMIDDSMEFDSHVKQEAEKAAIAWRKRLIAEGGFNKATEADAQGLLLFIGCFGIPKAFVSGDIWDLIQLCNLKNISDALRRSRVLVSRVSDILGKMMDKGMKIEAVDVAQAFGIEDKFPPQKLLMSFLEDSNKALERRRREANNSAALLKEACQKHLATLKSTKKFLEDRKLDPLKLLSGFQFGDKIESLEKEIGGLNKKIDDKARQKRKADEIELLNNLKSQEARLLRFNASPRISSPSIGLHEHRVTGHVDGSGLLSAPIRGSILDDGLSGHTNNLPVAGSGLYGSGSNAAAYGAPSTISFPGVYREMHADRTGQIIESNGSAYRWRGVGETSILDGTRGQSFVHQPASRLFGSSAPIEGFAGLPDASPAGTNRNSISDLYRFADAVK